MCWRTPPKDENVSREQRLRRLASLVEDGIPSLTRAKRAEARCWGVCFSELDVADPEFIPGRPERSLKFALHLPRK